MLVSKSVSESNDNLIGFIASNVEKLRDDVETMRGQMSTKEDLARVEGRLSERVDAVSHRVDGMSDRLDSMSDQMATKEDLARLEGRLSERLDASTTGIRGDIEQVHLRLNGIEHSVSSRFEHVEGELSRLRSAVYLLGKDRPEILRLLGTEA